MKPDLPPVPEYFDVDRARFDGEIVPAGRPAVLRGLVADWPIVRAATTSDEALATYLGERATGEPGEAWFGKSEIGGRFGFNEALDGHNHERKQASVAQLLELLIRQKGHGSPYGIYAGALPARKHVPALLDENVMPLLAPDRRMLVSLWLGNRTKTAAHWDLPQNLACVVAGRRRFTLFPTEAVNDLYVGPIDFTLAGQPSSLADVEEPDFERFPRLREAYKSAQVSELEPGDVLYLPSLWWHAVTSLDDVGALINYWWRDGAERMISPQYALLAAVLTMQELPERERAAWRAMFDHYVFRDGGDPAAHLPRRSRGILGPRTADLVAGMKAYLAGALTPRR